MAVGRQGLGQGHLGHLGSASGSIGPTPGTPVLTWTSGTTDLTPEGTVTFDNVPVAGDTLTSQIQVAGGNWSSPVINNSHIITAGEDLVNQVDLVNTALTAGSYDWRVRVTHNSAASAWSNTETKTLTSFTPADLTPNVWFEPARGGLFQSNAGTTAASANSDVVGFMPDQSGNTFTVTSVADDTTRPTLQGVGVNPYISFDGTNDLLRRTAGIGGGGWTAGATSWFVAVRAATPAAESTLAGEWGSANSCRYSLIMSQVGSFSSVSDQSRNDAGSSITGMFNNILKAGAFDGSDHVIGIVDNGSSVTAYIDGVAGSAAAYTRGANTITVNLFTLGARMPGGVISNWMNFRLYGGVFVNRVLTAPEIANLTTYLGTLQGRTI